MVNEEELRGKRIYVGLLAIGCLVGAAATMILRPDDTGLLGALIRVGMLLSAFWLAMPTATRPAAWKRLPSSNWAIFGMIISAILIPRLKYMFPVLAVFAGVAWFARPRK